MKKYTWYYDDQYSLYMVTDGNAVVAMFENQWEAEDYCAAHNKKGK